MIDATTAKEAVTLESVIRRYGVELKPQGKELVACCPFHEERTPSFTVTPERQLAKCFGCGWGGDVLEFVKAIEGVTFQQAVSIVADAAGLIESGNVEHRRIAGENRETRSAVPTPTPASVEPAAPAKLVAAYPYTDANGTLLYEVLRYEPKTFKQRKPNGAWGIADVERVLYRLPQVLAADTVLLCEGEKDVATCEALGFTATTNSGGANGKWTPAMVEALRGKHVAILPDQDDPGTKRGLELAVLLKPVAASVVQVHVPTGKDVTDYVEAGGDLAALIDRTATQARRDELEREFTGPEDILWLAGGAAAFLEKQEPGVQTGFRDYDYMTGGLYPGEMTILAARPSMGKTALAMNIAEYVAVHRGPVAVFSVEMSKRSLLTRMVASRARVTTQDLRRGTTSQDDRRRLQAALAEIVQLPLYLDDTGGLTVALMREKLARLKRACGMPALVVIDYLQLLQGDTAKENRNQEVSAISRGVKLALKEWNVPGLVLAQLSRASEARMDKTPQLSDLRDSGSIEQDADVVALIHREEYYKRDDPQHKGLADVIIAKQRNGPVGKVGLGFVGKFTQFVNLERYREEAA